MTQNTLKVVANSVFFKQVIEYLEQGKEVVFSLRGSSMSPFLLEGDLVRVKPHSGIPLRIGHIVLATTPTGFVMHRIIRMDNQHIYLAGDANFVQIEKIEKSALVAFLVGASRNEKEIPIYKAHILWYARLWYYGRPLRRVWAKVFKRLHK